MARLYPSGCAECGAPKESVFKPACNPCTEARKARLQAKNYARWYEKIKTSGKKRVLSERAYRARRARHLEKKMSKNTTQSQDFICRPNLQYFKLSRCAEGVSLSWGVLLIGSLPVEGSYLDVERLTHLRVIADTPQEAFLLAQEREQRERD